MQIRRAVGAIESRGGRLAVLTTLLLLAGAVALIAFPKAVVLATGKAPAQRLTAPDELPAAGRDDPTPFLVERNTLVVQVDTPMTVRQFLEVNRLQRPDLRKQVLDQLGNPSLDSNVAAGTRLTLTLTPKATDVPGTGAAVPVPK
ncbi:MAG TPA: hypothetical protein VNI54_02940 [Thermoanaerobaculia bacterium]|nr:hypothetical protein [Thermoanaerobaculia bacterium]